MKKLGKITAIVAILLFFGAGTYAGYVYSQAETTVNSNMHSPVTSIDHEETKKKVEDKETINILLMGVDEREGDRGRSDTLLVASVQPSKEKTNMISIPRDTRTVLGGNEPESGRMDKINHAYAFGGVDMAVDTVETFMDMELDYYVRINMEGLVELVDAVNGVTVTNDRAFTQGGIEFPEGEIDLSGNEALEYARMRKNDPNGDLGRNERQREVIKGVVDKAASFSSVSKIQGILDVLGGNVTTNADFDTMKMLFQDYRKSGQNIDTYQMKGSGVTIDGIYYMQMPDEEIAKAKSLITPGS
ncbi:LCP family glycopolymer transferase [Salimicrobium jeotgali]|uniref:LCP family glycopolymer transferase n=1 Tax=Salimicrobium jeotgali TaxID=1230341 RepID=UPI000C8507D0|nr:LCP family protein [Salimicrobium jeotgali]